METKVMLSVLSMGISVLSLFISCLAAIGNIDKKNEGRVLLYSLTFAFLTGIWITLIVEFLYIIIFYT